MDKSKIIIDQEKCLGCGSCVAQAPNTFQFNQEGKVELTKGDNLDEENAVKDSIVNCPTACIAIID